MKIDKSCRNCKYYKRGETIFDTSLREPLFVYFGHCKRLGKSVRTDSDHVSACRAFKPSVKAVLRAIVRR